MFFITLIGVVFAFYHFFDVIHFIKVYSIPIKVKKRKRYNEKFVIEETVGFRDLDEQFHMNNARYFWHSDFARLKYLSDTGKYLIDNKLYTFIKNNKI